MDKRRPGAPTAVEGVPPSEEELAQVTPRDLYPVSDIRFVMLAVAKLEAKVDRLIDDVKGQDGKFSDIGNKMGSVETRMARVEACAEHTQGDIREGKEDFKKLKETSQLDFRILFGAIITVALGLAALMAHGFKWF